MTTNTFNFTFTVDSQTEVVPKTYAGSQNPFPAPFIDRPQTRCCTSRASV